MDRTASPTADGLLGPADLVDQQVPGQLVMARDVIIYTLRRVLEGLERIELWAVPYAGGRARPLTTGAHRDHSPRPSPTGRQLAFLRTEGSGVTRVGVLELPDGPTRILTDVARGASALAWSLDEAALFVVAEGAESARVYRAPGVPTDVEPTALRPGTIDWRGDGEGSRGLRLHPSHLYRVPLDGARVVQVTHGPWSVSRPNVDERGRLYFLADTDGDADLHPAPQVHWVELQEGDSSEIHQLTRVPGGVDRYHVRDGRLRVLAQSRPDRPDDDPTRWYELADDGDLRLLGCTEESPRWAGRLGDETDLHEWQLELDDSFEVTTSSWDGSSAPVSTHTGAALLDGPMVCGAIAEDGTRRVAVAALGTGAQAPDVYAIEDGSPRRLTDHGAWLDHYHRPNWKRCEFQGPGGPITVHLLQPSDTVEPKGIVLALHGGPTGQWGVVPTVEALLLAGSGYRVAMPNIRGSIDRGPAWVTPLRGAWGTVDAADVLATCDGLLGAGLAEEGRLGVIGLSYGGFLTEWLIGITDRFAAAVTENGVTNQVAAWAACDTGPAFCRSAGLGDTLSPEGVEQLWGCSPLRHVAEIRTPLLMLQAAEDRICPASDNEQLFVALRALQREVEYIVYPEESHLMQATGRIDRRIDRHQRVLSWFDTHLAPGSHR